MKKPPLREVVLWLSLGLNVALISGIGFLAYSFANPSVGRFMAFPPPPGMGPFPPDSSFIAKKLNLNADQKAKMEVIFLEAKTDAKGDFEKLKTMRLRIIQFIVENPEDEEGLNNLLDESSDIPKEFAQNLLNKLRRFVLVLDDDQRQSLLKEIEAFENY